MDGKGWVGVGVIGMALALAGTPGDVSAQEAVVGIKGGIDSYSVSWSPDSIAPSIGHKTGFIGGVFGGVTFTSVIGLQLEALYSGRSIVDQDSDTRLSTDYFEVPLLVTAKFPLESTLMRPILFAGPSVSFQSKCELSGELEGTELTVDCDDPRADVQTEDTDWGIVFGAGVDYPLGDFLIGGEFRYNLGLTNLNADEETSGFETVKGRMWAILLTVGYAF